MKTLNLFLIALFMCSFSLLQAQHFGIGLRVGTNIAKFKASEDGTDIDTDSNAGLQLGLILDAGITDLFSIQPEIHLTQKGYKTNVDFLGNDLETTLTLNYIDVPINFKFSFGSEKIKGFALFGPAFGFAATGKATLCNGGDCESDDIEFDSDDGFNRAEASFNLGGGAAFRLGPGDLVVDIRYLLGLTNLSDDEDSEIKNRGFGIGVSYVFIFGGDDE